MEKEERKMNIYEKLLAMQGELKAPKNQLNKFGGYNYRSCEDILEALKPLLAKYDVAMVIQDDVEAVGDRVYVKATVTLIDSKNYKHNFNYNGTTDEGPFVVSNTAFAREARERKGMDDSQITGTASSYARKYALGGMFAIDDTKDADTNEYAKATESGRTADANKIARAKEKVSSKAAADGKKALVRVGTTPETTQVLNDKGQYVTLDSLSRDILGKIAKMEMFKAAWPDVAVMLERKKDK